MTAARLRAAAARLAALADTTLAGLTDPEPGTGERWDAGQVWAHLAEFPGYWLRQADDVIGRAAAGEPQPIPFGRTKTDAGRIGAIERDRRDDPRALMARVADGIAAVASALDGWSADALATIGLHPTLGPMPAAEIVERFVASHLEEHAAQLDGLAAGEAPEIAAVMQRIFAFSHGIEDRSSTRRLTTPSGTLLLNDDYPLSHSHNFLRVEGPRPGPSAQTLDAEARRLLRVEAGRTHLQVLFEDATTAARLAPGLRALGWSATPLIYMVQRGEPSIPSAAAAELAAWQDVRQLVQRDHRSVPETSDNEVVRQLTERREAIARATRLRHVVAPAGGPYLARADIYSDGCTLQIESVVTLAEARNRGLARAVVLEGVRIGREEGHDLIFLIAEEEDWPKDLYARLGFETVGGSIEFAHD